MEPPPKVRVLRFEFCPEGVDCKFMGDAHLLVFFQFVSLKNGNAIAISYTWGEFDRRDVPIGHESNGRPVAMNLGCEWTLPEFSTKLVNLGSELKSGDAPYMPLWIDQLSIRQDDETELRASLASIPQIYSILDVVALMPGSPCKCLQESLDEYGGQRDRENDEADLGLQAAAAWSMKINSCLNCTGFCSYFDRLWTRQEFMYAQKIHVEWTHPELSKCAKYAAWSDANLFLEAWNTNAEGKAEVPQRFENKIKEHYEDLAPFARRTFERFLSEGWNYTHALARTVISRDKSWHGALKAIEDYVAAGESRVLGRKAALTTLCQLLAGHTLANRRRGSEAQDTNDEERLQLFIFRLYDLGRSRRSATKPKDYVLAVWIDCPGYILPHNFHSLDLPLLLEDAILQLENNYEISVPVSAMAGLFGSLKASALWRPSCYLHNVRVSHAGQVYGVIRSECAPLVLTEACGPSLIMHDEDLGRSSDLQDYEEFFNSKETMEVVKYVQKIVSRWPILIIERLLASNDTLFKNNKDGIRGSWRNIIMQGHSSVQEALSTLTVGDADAQSALSRADPSNLPVHPYLYDAVFELVSTALGLDFQLCRAMEDLHLVIYGGNHPAIGLLNRSKDPLEFPLEDLDAVSSNTVCRDLASPATGCTLLEVVQLKSLINGRTRCYATGIWVPQEVTSFTEVGGFHHDDISNAEFA